MKKLKLETDFIDFVKLCNKYEVEYLVIGGYAVSIHGYPRSTKDFGFASLKLTKGDFLKKDFITQLGHEPVRIDILNDLDGVPFEQAWMNKRVMDFEGSKINFIGYYELLQVKEKAGRPQDIADISKLKSRNKKK